MANFIGLVYATLKNEGIDTKDMSTDEAVKKYNELQEKSGGKAGEKEGTPAEQKRLKELQINKPLSRKEKAEKEKQDRIEKFSNYIKGQKEKIEPYQKGIANKDTFFHTTIAEFQPVDKPQGEPDYISKDDLGTETGSKYWYTKDGVIRGSDHWGKGISSCDWGLKGEELKTNDITLMYDKSGNKTTKYGFAKWQYFSQKPTTLRLDGKEIISNFDNFKGIMGNWAIYKINNKYYHGAKDALVTNLYQGLPD